MGWCQEFGLEVTAGCDHAMIAGRDCCSCPDCGTVCRGRFAGCPVVWSGAAIPVVAHAVPLALVSGPTPGRPALTNGRSSAPEATAELRSPADVPVAGQMDPMAGAEGDLRQLCADLKFEVRRLSRKVDRLADEGQRVEREAVLSEVDARFEWLTDQLSDRLVILGNEIMAIKRHLGADSEPDADSDSE